MIFGCDNGKLSDVDDREKTPRLSDLNKKYMAIVSNEDRKKNEALFNAVHVYDGEAGRVLKAAKELRLVLPKHIRVNLTEKPNTSQMQSVDEFLRIAPNILKDLEQRGFYRASAFEESSPTLGVIVYSGDWVAFVFSFDFRDQCVDAEVVKIKDGKILRNWEGGYSAGLFTHLVNEEGYRGGPNGTSQNLKSLNSSSPIEKTLEGLLNLIEKAGSKLLEDKPDSLP